MTRISGALKSLSAAIAGILVFMMQISAAQAIGGDGGDIVEGGVSIDGGGTSASYDSTPSRVRALTGPRTGSGLAFELHGKYYQILGPTNIFSGHPTYHAARQRLYDLLKTEWSGYYGVLRTETYAANDALAHLVAGKKVEMLSDQQVRMLLTKHLPQEAHLYLPATAKALTVSELGVAASTAQTLRVSGNVAVRTAAARGATVTALGWGAAEGALLGGAALTIGLAIVASVWWSGLSW